MKPFRSMLFALLGLFVFSPQAFAYTAVFCNNSSVNTVKVSLANSQAGCDNISNLDVIDGQYASYGSSGNAARSMGGIFCSGACFTTFTVHGENGAVLFKTESRGLCESVRFTINNVNNVWTAERDSPPSVDFTNWNQSSASGTYCKGKLTRPGVAENK